MELEVLDVGVACRLCLSVDTNHEPIFQDSAINASDGISLKERISACVGFEIHQSDDLPSLICSHCLQEVDRWFDFRSQCRSTNELMNRVILEGYQFISVTSQEKVSDATNAALDVGLHDSTSNLENVDKQDAPCSASQDESSCASSVPQLGNSLVTVQSIGLLSENKNEIQVENSDEESNDAVDIFKSGDSFEERYGEDTNDGHDLHWRLKPVSCPLCSKSFNKHSGVKLHLRVVHTILNVYPCLICAHVSCSSTDRKKHIAKRHPIDTLKKNTCTICGIHLLSTSSFRRHLRRHDSDRQCDLCSLELDTIEALQKHKKAEHQEEPPDGVDPSYHCHLCKNLSFWKKSDWKDHYLDAHNTEEVFPCLLCDRAYRTKALLSVHLRCHSGEKPYMCEQCATRFSSKDSLRNHMRKHTNRFECKLCQRTYTSNAGLLYHMRTHSGEMPYVCHECGKTFKSLNGVQFHLRIHTGEKPYSCDHCDFTCRNYSGLYAHKVIHSNERPFECDECGKTFKMKGWLKEHKKTHARVKDHVCTMCNHRFISSFQLKSHMKTHSGERPFMCEFCPKAFARKDTLTEHMRIHTKEAKYSCKTCLGDFVFLKTFKKHKCLPEILDPDPDKELVSDNLEDNVGSLVTI